MSLLTSETSLSLWREVVQNAEHRCAINLENELEAYLVLLLNHYISKPEMTKQVFATAFLEALQNREKYRSLSLQHVGDQCLIFAGLFPRQAEKRQVKLNYFVDIGRAAYRSVSRESNDLYGALALQFVSLMDVLHSIRPYSDLLPLEAYEQWDELGSQYAFQALREFSHAIPQKYRRN